MRGFPILLSIIKALENNNAESAATTSDELLTVSLNILNDNSEEYSFRINVFDRVRRKYKKESRFTKAIQSIIADSQYSDRYRKFLRQQLNLF